MSKKVKLSDLAKDLNVPGQELIDQLAQLDNTKRKPGSSLEDAEVNYLLERYSQNNQVDSFDAYFADRTQKTARAKKEEAPVEKAKPVKRTAKAAKAEEKPMDEPKAKKAEPKKKEEKPVETKTEPVKQEAPKAEEKPVKEAPKAEAKAETKPEVQKDAPKKEEAPKAEKPASKKPIKTVTPPPAKAKAPDTARYAAAKEKAISDQKPAKPVKQTAPKSAPQTGQKIGSMASADAVVEKKQRTVDTRGSYVELDKYNERYEQIAPQNKHKDNYSTKKQKINQKSQQRAKQQHSSKRETEAEKLRRLELERARKQQLKVLIPDSITVSELAARLKVNSVEVIKKLMGLGVMATINEVIDFDTASLVAEELGAKVEKEVIITIEERLIEDVEDAEEDLEERSPVIVVMGHVDHGKTSILDRIRHADVAASEAGGITQHIGAYQVRHNGKKLTFLDTPGHEAFTAMRARGANITDIAILVVAADDGIMPQTIESIHHAKAAGVSIIVAINKMDKEGADPDRIKQELTEHELVCEEWGGDVICVPVSAKTGEGIDDLLENVQLIAEFRELKANPNRQAKGTVIEARLDKGRGPIATILIQNGTLHTGDVIIAGTAVGRVRVMTNHKGKVVKTAGPSVPVEITGLAEVPSAGDVFNAVEDERLARELVEQRKHEAKQEQFKSFQKVTLDSLFSHIAEGEMKELALIVKADVQGSVEAVKQSLEKISNEEVRVKVIHGAVGAISESDVMLASASNAIIIGFNVRPDPTAADSAARDGVDIRTYRIIYDAIEEITTAMKGMLAPKFREKIMGRIEVRQVYKISNVGAVAGSYVLDGKVTRACEIRVVRDGIVIAEDKIDSLKRFKDDVKEVATSYECGITLEKFSDIKEGDIFEAFIMEEYRED